MWIQKGNWRKLHTILMHTKITYTLIFNNCAMHTAVPSMVSRCITGICGGSNFSKANDLGPIPAAFDLVNAQKLMMCLDH